MFEIFHAIASVLSWHENNHNDDDYAYVNVKLFGNLHKLPQRRCQWTNWNFIVWPAKRMCLCSVRCTICCVCVAIYMLDAFNNHKNSFTWHSMLQIISNLKQYANRNGTFVRCTITNLSLQSEQHACTRVYDFLRILSFMRKSTASFFALRCPPHINIPVLFIHRISIEAIIVGTLQWQSAAHV